MARICFVLAVTTDDAGLAEARAASEGAAARVPSPRPVRKPLGRAWQWFWRGDAMSDANRPMSPRRVQSLRRAQLAAEVARRTSESPEPFVGSVDPIVCDLYRQSVHWSLEGLASDAAVQPEVRASEGLWGTVDRVVLLKAAGSADALGLVAKAVDVGSFQEFAALAPEECTRLLGALSAVASALIAELELSRRVVEALWLQRALRLGLLFVLLVIGLGVASKVRDGAERKRDLAIGKAWRTSSWYGGCHSPEQECADSPEFFFHTQEEKGPWVELDLGSKPKFSAIRVDNRKDCCTERAAPLVVEVGDDQQHWKIIARRDAVFSSWLAQFAPTKARFVRLRAETRGPLHLAGVRVLQ